MTKKTLIELMLENNVQWPEGAEYAAQDRNNSIIYFYRRKPVRESGMGSWIGETVWESVNLPELCRNWHQTIVTREQYEAAQVIRNAAERAQSIKVDVKLSPKVEDARTLDTIVANIKECDEKINHHSAVLATYTDERVKFIDELNEMLAGVGVMVVDDEPAAEESEWPDYCDENGIVVDWDRVPKGSEVECVVSHYDSVFYQRGRVYMCGADKYGDKGPFDSDGDVMEGERDICSFRLIK